jgi:hypothetical protein
MLRKQRTIDFKTASWLSLLQRGRPWLLAVVPPGHVHAQSLPGGHHFDGAYDKLAELITQRIATP